VCCVDIILKRKPQGMTMDELYNALVSYPDEAVIAAITALDIAPRCRCTASRTFHKERLRYHLRKYKLDNHLRPFICIPPLGAKKNAGVSERERWVNVERLAAFASEGKLSVSKVIADLNRAELLLRQQGNETLATANAVAGFAARLENNEVFQQPPLLGDGLDDMPALFTA
jgi:hypothetical protein